jgi:ABC-2 type transport system permease protein
VGTTPLTRSDVLGGKAVAVLAVEAGQILLLSVIGGALGWRPDTVGLLLLVPLTLLGSAALAALALLLAGVVRAEATLAVANLAYLLLAGAGVVIPLDQLPEGVQRYVQLLPSAALAEALRLACADGTLAWSLVGVLLVWLAATATAVGRWFRWE